MDDKEIKKRIDKGAILAQVSFEIIGNPKEYVETSIKEYLENIKKDEGMNILNEEIGEAEEIEGNLFSSYADVEILFNNLEKINWLCINFMPANIEILAPTRKDIEDKELTAWFNDNLSKLHEISTKVRQVQINNDALVKGMNALIQNSILLAAKTIHNPEEISKTLGIPLKQLEPFFNALIKKGKIQKEDFPIFD